MLHHWERPEVGIPALYRLICPSWQGWATLAFPGTAREGLMSEDTGPAPCTLYPSHGPMSRRKRGEGSALPPWVWLLPREGNVGCGEAVPPNVQPLWAQFPHMYSRTVWLWPS